MPPAQPYLAIEPIFIDGVRAFNPGDVVPDGHVERHDLSDKVARAGTKAADKALDTSS